MSTGRASPQFLLRLPDDMREQLKAAAEANKRSMNAEIVARLQISLGGDVASKHLPAFSQALGVLAEKLMDAARLAHDTDRDLVLEIKVGPSGQGGETIELDLGGDLEPSR